MQRNIVVGPGHNLNELTHRLLAVQAMVADDPPLWELYPGQFGLYARHSDDYAWQKDDKMIDHYNDFCRFGYDLNAIDKFPRPAMYVNVPKGQVQKIIDCTTANFYSTYMDMKNNPEMRWHYVIMETSIGAAEDVDYSKQFDLNWICQSIRRRYESEQQMMNSITDVKWISASKILKKDYSDFDTVDPRWDAVVDEYNHQNRLVHPTLEHIVEMPWEEINECK